MNQRPPGYEPDELPDCSTPRSEVIIAKKIVLSKMAGAGRKPNSVAAKSSDSHLSPLLIA